MDELRKSLKPGTVARTHMEPSRRAFLGSVAVTVGLAGCTGGTGDSGSGGQSTDSPTASPSSATDEPMESPSPTSGSEMEPDATVTVGPGGDLRFEPETLEVEMGATVEFVWDSSGHTVTVDAQPDGAGWEATGQSTKSAGFTHTHTFDVAGQYDYYCVPHRSAGMTGTVLVGDASMGTGSATPSPTATPAGTAAPTPTPTPTSGSGGDSGDDGDDGGYY